MLIRLGNNQEVKVPRGLARTRSFGRPQPLWLATRLLPVASAVVVTLAGLAISASALPGVLGG